MNLLEKGKRCLGSSFFGGGLCVFVFMNLHMTALPDPDIPLFLYYSYGSFSLWGVSDCRYHQSSL